MVGSKAVQLLFQRVSISTTDRNAHVHTSLLGTNFGQPGNVHIVVSSFVLNSTQPTHWRDRYIIKTQFEVSNAVFLLIKHRALASWASWIIGLPAWKSCYFSMQGNQWRIQCAIFMKARESSADTNFWVCKSSSRPLLRLSIAHRCVLMTPPCPEILKVAGNIWSWCTVKFRLIFGGDLNWYLEWFSISTTVIDLFVQ